MIGRELPARDLEDVTRLIRALGSHRYVASRGHHVHAAALRAAAHATPTGLDEAIRWAHETFAIADLDPSSRDERLFRTATEAEITSVLEAFWGERGQHARGALESWFHEQGLPIETGTLFDEELEDDIHPVLIDAGWELLPLSSLDPERHRGAIEAYGERIAFDSAKFEEESALEKPIVLQELCLFGAHELISGMSSGLLKEPLVLWTDGEPIYQDYVLRGVLRAAKLSQGS